MEPSGEPTAGEASPWWYFELVVSDREMANKAPPPDHQTTEPRSQNLVLIGCQAETVLGLPWAADSCPWVGKLRTVLPSNDRVIRDSAVQLGLTHQRGVLTHQRART